MEYRGNVASAGIAIGKAFIFKPHVPSVKHQKILQEQVEQELSTLKTACAMAGEELDAVIARLEESDPEKAEIIVAHRSILDDTELLDEIELAITDELCCVKWAIQKGYNEFADMMREADDELLAERASDLDDVCNRLLRCTEGIPEVTLANLREPCIVVAEELYPSETVLMDASNVLGIITERGGITSHTAIIAKSYGIPAVLGVKKATERLAKGTVLVLDALKGIVITDFDEDVLEHYTALSHAEVRKKEIAATYLDKKAMTKDGVRIDIEANVGSTSPNALKAAEFTDGVGLFRTEFLYMEATQLPDEDTQYEAYRTVLEAFDGRTVVLRTLDIGGDKHLSYKELPHEENPFLGKRALRLCLDEPEMFKTQLRAALRSSVHGDLWVMFPMVSGLDEVRIAKQMVKEAEAELTQENIPYDANIKIGVMIEIPAAALIADLIAQEVDFASIGTNDLIQYLTATDRLNSEVSQYYQSFHPAVLRLIKMVSTSFSKYGKDLCICGELGGNTAGAVALIGLGVRRLSMSASNVAEIKQVVANISVAEAEEAVEKTLSMSTAAEIETYLKGFVAEKVGGV